MVFFNLQPYIINHHLNKASTRNNDLLFFKDSRNDCFLYLDKDFPTYPGEKLHWPPKEFDLKCLRTLVGSCDGVLCIFDVYLYSEDSIHAERALMWNPSIRKIVPIPVPSAIFKWSTSYTDHFGFGFDSIANDYKLVRVVYMRIPHIDGIWDPILPPLVEVYSLKRGCWRLVDNDLKYVIKRGRMSAFVNGSCHWVVHVNSLEKRHYALKVIVYFNFEDEKIGELIVPDCVLFKEDMDLYVTVFDGLLSVVPLWAREGHYSIWAMKEYGNPQSWIKLFNIEHLRGRMSSFLGFKKNGELFLGSWDGFAISYLKTKKGSVRISNTKIWEYRDNSYLGFYTESLVLLCEANSTLTENSSGDKANRISEDQQHSSVADKNKNKKKGKKNMGSFEGNRILEGDGSSCTNGGNTRTLEARDFGAKNRIRKEKKMKKWKYIIERTNEGDEFPRKHPSSAAADTVRNEASKEHSSSSSAAKKKGKKNKIKMSS